MITRCQSVPRDKVSEQELTNPPAIYALPPNQKHKGSPQETARGDKIRVLIKRRGQRRQEVISCLNDSQVRALLECNYCSTVH